MFLEIRGSLLRSKRTIHELHETHEVTLNVLTSTFNETPMILSERQSSENHDDRLILLTGATGYVGGRLLRVLEEQGHRVRCLARRPEFLKSKVSAGTEIVAGDVL